MGEVAGAARDQLPEDSIWRSLACLVHGVSLHLRGDLEAGRSVLAQGARQGGIGAPNVAAICRAQLALLELDCAEPGQAAAQMQEGMRIADRYGLLDDPTQALVVATSALLNAREGQSADAARDAKLAGRLVAELNEFSAWYEAETRIVIARALLQLDDVAGARARLGEAGRHLRNAPDAKVLRSWIELAWHDADAAQSVTGRWPLTPAELRLLHHLPSHLTYREIADELFVSANTVKTQAQSIYRKLGASSRSEAVACARSAGLLDETPAPAERGSQFSPRSRDA
jgi:LuxR family maltose regulon positive regulatory protein